MREKTNRLARTNVLTITPCSR